MSLMYHPLSRNISHRGTSGCLTPNNHIESDNNSPTISKQENIYSNKGSTDGGDGSRGGQGSGSSTILSPPLSPYQRNGSINEGSHETIEEDQGVLGGRNYVTSTGPFKIENYKQYELNVNAWSGLDVNYKAKQVRFLEQYSIISARERVTAPVRRHAGRKRELNSDSESDYVHGERVRTRRTVKESSTAPGTMSELETSRASSQSPSPKRKKVRKEGGYSGSPLAVQQAAFIDENIPDYSPDTDTLPKNNNRSLKVEWKGQPMDLRNDPNASKLHPSEVLLASTLRLPCNVYLDSKRRLFYEKVSRAKSGMQFRRTDAQKACRIDVNKASRLFAAFEKVGWLNDVHFTKYL